MEVSHVLSAKSSNVHRIVIGQVSPSTKQEDVKHFDSQFTDILWD